MRFFLRVVIFLDYVVGGGGVVKIGVVLGEVYLRVVNIRGN